MAILQAAVSSKFPQGQTNRLRCKPLPRELHPQTQRVLTTLSKSWCWNQQTISQLTTSLEKKEEREGSCQYFTFQCYRSHGGEQLLLLTNVGTLEHLYLSTTPSAKIHADHLPLAHPTCCIPYAACVTRDPRTKRVQTHGIRLAKSKVQGHCR